MRRLYLHQTSRLHKGQPKNEGRKRRREEYLAFIEVNFITPSHETMILQKSKTISKSTKQILSETNPLDNPLHILRTKTKQVIFLGLLIEYYKTQKRNGQLLKLLISLKFFVSFLRPRFFEQERSRNDNNRW